MKLLPVTALSAWIRCPKQFYITYVLEEKTPLNGGIVLGLIKHKLHETISKTEQEIVEKLNQSTNNEQHIATQYSQMLAKIVQTYKNLLREVKIPIMTAYQQVMPIVKYETRELIQKIQKLNEKGLKGEELWQAITPKIKTEYTIQSEKLGIKGRIDKLEIHGDRIIPIELKSGNAPQDGTWPEHAIQAVSYALMLEEQFNTTIPETIVHYIDFNSKRTIHLNPFHKEQVTETIKKIKNCLETKEIPSGCGKEKCPACQIDEKTLKQTTTLPQKTLNMPLD